MTNTAHSAETSTLLLIGCGNMGSALLSAWQASTEIRTHIQKFIVVDPVAHESIQAHTHPHTQHLSSLDALPNDALTRVGTIVLAVKPQQLDTLLPALASRLQATCPLYLTIAAGKPIAFYEEKLGNDAAIIRAMPNTPALIGKGMTALFANAHTSEGNISLSETLMRVAGQTLWLEKEDDMHAVTALSGSGPAYVFAFMEALVEGSIALGLSKPVATQLALHTVCGASQLAIASDHTLTALQANVTSKGGTTEAGINLLCQNDALQKLIAEALNAAYTRSKELT